MKHWYRFVDAVLRWLTEPRNTNTVDKLLMVWMTVMALLCVRIIASLVF